MVRSAILGAFAFCSLGCWAFDSAVAQPKSVSPVKSILFRDPKVSEFVERFEIESRDVFVKRKAIIAACNLEAGSIVADISAGKRVLARLFTDTVGTEGKALAVDIAQNSLKQLNEVNRETNRRFEAEIISSGFKTVREHSGLLKENYFIEFEKVSL